MTPCCKIVDDLLHTFNFPANFFGLHFYFLCLDYAGQGYYALPHINLDGAALNIRITGQLEPHIICY